MDSLLRAVAIGFAIAAPIGPIGVLCIRRSLGGGMIAGLLCGLGAATADALYAAVAASTLSAATTIVTQLEGPLRVMGALVLLYLGVRTARAGASEGRTSSAETAGLHSYATTLGLTLINPATIASFTAIVAGTMPSNALRFAFGVFVGSTLWWVVLSSAVAAMRRGVTASMMRLVNVASGSALATFGAWTLAMSR
jgi:threonine/homoserine/homoserine lactone efflux protein